MTEKISVNSNSSTNSDKDKASTNVRFANDISSKIGNNKLEGQALEEAKKRVKDRLDMSQSMTADIKDGIAKTKESGYRHISHSPNLNKSGRIE